MSTQIQWRRGTTAQHASFTGAIAEVTVDTDKKTVVVHDGSTSGGFPLRKETDVVEVVYGGTGANSASSARTNLGAAASGANTDITSLNSPQIGAATATTQSSGDNSTKVATTAFVSSAISVLNVGTNKFINDAMGIDQRNAGAAQTITAAAALAYTVDRWYAYCTGANVTGQRVAGTAPNKFNYRFTGAASVTKIGFAQRIEAANCQDLAGQTATLSVDLANSLLTTVTWTAWYANTEDTFGTLASPTRTQIATGTFTVTSTLTRYSTQISIPSAATTGIEIEFSVGAQTSGTWTIGRAQLEVGGVATAFEYREVASELAQCQRYFCAGSARFDGQATLSTSFSTPVKFPVTMRTTPTVSQTNTSNVGFGTGTGSANITQDAYWSARTATGTGAGQFAETFTASAEL